MENHITKYKINTVKTARFFVKLSLTKKYKLCMSEVLESTCKKIKSK